MDQLAGNYNADATVDDGSCAYSGCKDAEATNYFCTANAAAFCCAGTNGYTLDALTDDGSCAYPACCNDSDYVEYVEGCRNHQQSMCIALGIGRAILKKAVTITPEVISIGVAIDHSVEIANVNGEKVYAGTGREPSNYRLSEITQEAGIYFIKVITPAAVFNKKVLALD